MEPEQLELTQRQDHQSRSTGMRATSHAAWASDHRRKAPARAAAYDHLVTTTGITAAELGAQCPAAGKCPWKRLGELVEMGVVEERAERVCTVTGERVLTYAALPGVLPGAPPPKRPTAPAKPSADEMTVALDEILEMLHGRGRVASPELAKMGKWIRYQAQS